MGLWVGAFTRYPVGDEPGQTPRPRSGESLVWLVPSTKPTQRRPSVPPPKRGDMPPVLGRFAETTSRGEGRPPGGRPPIDMSASPGIQLVGPCECCASTVQPTEHETDIPGDGERGGPRRSWSGFQETLHEDHDEIRPGPRGTRPFPRGGGRSGPRRPAFGP